MSLYDYYGAEQNSANEEFIYPTGLEFERFKKANPAYLKNLNDYIKIIYETCDNLRKGRDKAIYEDPQQKEIVSRLGFGMLMRHALEVISIDLAMDHNISVSDKTVFERLEALKWQTISGCNEEQKALLFKALDLTNEIAHPHMLGHNHSFKELYYFYKNQFREVVLYFYARSSRRAVLKYLSALMQRLDAFRFDEKIVRYLTLGNLVRQLTECTVNVWCYNFELVPTDASTIENQLGISLALKQLAALSKANDHLLDRESVSILYLLKNTSNNLMHVTPDQIKLRRIKKYGKIIERFHSRLFMECAPNIVELKTTRSLEKRAALIATLLCGFFGNFGVHHFYAGNIKMGILFLLTGGLFSIGPFVSLKNIYSNNFETNRWGRLFRTKFTGFLDILFIIIHATVLFYFIFLR